MSTWSTRSSFIGTLLWELRYGLAGVDARAALVVDRDRAVDDHERNSDRKLAGIRVGRRVVHRRRVEHDDVGVVTGLQAAASGQAEAARGAIGHSMHDLLQAQR